jgi:beta-glucanase (GH16 family)
MNLSKRYKSIQSFGLGVCFLFAAMTDLQAISFALVADGGNHRIAEFYVNGTTWMYAGNFADNNTTLTNGNGGFLGALVSPNTVVQDQQGRIYVSDQNGNGGNRILRFDGNGVFLGMVGTNGINGFKVPGSGVDDMALGPDGNIYASIAFGAANNQILKYNVAANSWSVLYSNSATLSTPRGLAFAPDGNLYVNSRGNARMLTFSTNGILLRTNATFSGLFTMTPTGIRWDSVGNRFICTAGNGNSVVCSCTTNGVLSMITGINPTNGPGSASILGAVVLGTNIFYAPYKASSDIYLCNYTRTNAVTLAGSGTSPLLAYANYANFVTGLGLGEVQSGFPYNDSHWHLVWNDEFDGSSIDGSKWNVDDGTYHQGNNAAYYMASQVSVSDGALSIVAKTGIPSGYSSWQNSGGGIWNQYMAFTSGRITTKNKLNISAGYVEARMFLADDYGTWPAFWLLPNSGQWPPELDVMEHPIAVGVNGSVDPTTCFFQATHGANNHNTGGFYNTSASLQGWHTYGLAWSDTDGWFNFYLDGNLVSHQVNSDCNQNTGLQGMYMILNNACGGWADSDHNLYNGAVDRNGQTWTSSPFYVDYVRVFQWW